MNKKKLLALLAKKEARKAEIGTKANASEDVKELRTFNTELEGINQEIAELRTMIDSIKDETEENTDEVEDETEERGASKGAKSPVGRSVLLGSYGVGQTENQPVGQRKDVTKKYETRGADLKAKKAIVVSMEETTEERAVSLASGDLVVQKKYSNDMNEMYNDVSGLIDRVNAIPLSGGESYTKAFEVSLGEGDYTTETGNYAETDPVTDYVEIGKAKITAYTEMTDEAMKLPNINYQALVVKNVRTAIRKKITKMIVTGAGGSNALTGIFSAPTNVIPTDSDIEISEIDADTLDTIVFGYGGDEDVEGEVMLVLNKKDLQAFAAVRTGDGKKMYKIKKQGNTGTIAYADDGTEVTYVINSACPRLSLDATADDTYCMAYGKLANYEMPVFSPLTVEESKDYKFRSGQIAYRGSIWVGGNVAAYKGFVRIKKVAGA